MHKDKITVVGLGYVGLPLALEFSKFFKVIGFDINEKRVNELRLGIDKNNETSKNQIIKYLNKNLEITNNKKKLSHSDIFIITTPTPIFKNKKPNLNPITQATKLIAKYIKKNNIVIYESTVYPGLVEEVCVPIIENFSNLKYNKSFFCGYSPERINPGDKKHTLTNIVKIVSGSNKKTLKKIDWLYKKIIIAGTYKVSSIKVAEAAKVIENTQRDINIAFMNELSIIFDKMKIETTDVLNAAKTKWNFIDFQPGLVGGHCIGVDPYYLTHKAGMLGLNTKTILSGRKINDSMSAFVSNKIISNFKNRKKNINDYTVLIMGLSFKENCNELRNSKVFEIIDHLLKKNINCNLFDPNIDHNLLKRKYKSLIINNPQKSKYDAIVITVGHKIFKKIGKKNIRLFGKKKCFVFDIKNLFKEKKFETL